MKKILSVLLALAFAAGAIAGGRRDNAAAATGDTVLVKSVNSANEEIQVAVPINAARVVAVDLAALDMLDNLGLGDRVVGVASSAASIEYLAKYTQDSNIANCGTIREVDFETILACEPDIIFAGGRLRSVYDQLAEIAPTVLLPSASAAESLYEGVKANAAEIAKIWGKGSEVDALTASFETRIAAISAAASGQSAIIGLCTNGGFNVLGNTGRCSTIGKELGFRNVGVDFADFNERARAAAGETPHGNEISFEFLVQQNPDYIFVLDRDRAIGTQGAQLAAQILDNALVNSTNAARNGRIVILEHPAVWYMAEGGITAYDIMLADVESRVLGS